MSALPEYCPGFQFRYFVANKDGRRIKAKSNAEFRAAEDHVLRRFRDVLRHRPDMMEQLACLENGLEICLYQGEGFLGYDSELYFYGAATVNGDEVILELATEEVLHGGQNDHDVLDVVVHELIHIIDYLDDKDGVLPTWDANQRRRYYRAREREKVRIRDGVSPLVGYALTNDVEFLAVTGEVYFTKPAALQVSNKALFELFNAYFQQY